VTVFLVGAGPGDPGLLTVRGRDLLSEADAVLYDALVDPRLLGLTAPGCLLADVGKRGSAAAKEHSTAQDTINTLLVEYGRQYERVVRLKGGDPFVFGRGGEEALALAEAGIPFEVVPGVSSAIAAPAYAGIPVTHRGLASSVTIVTGHEAPGKSSGEATVDWGRLATATDTLVILMAVGKLPVIAAQLIAHGRPAETPAAVVEQGTTPQQRVVAGALATLPALAAEAGIRSPAAIVVGEVVRLRQSLAWFIQPIESNERMPMSAAS
jgi:uroporphyrin-III C-methyltransferase